MSRPLLVVPAVAVLLVTGCNPYRPSTDVIEIPAATTDLPLLQFPDAGPTKSPVQRDAFHAELAAAGIPAEKYDSLELWGRTVCSVNAHTVANGAVVNDADVVKRLPRDVANTGLKLTEHRAAAVWTSTKRHICS